jgi:hypothetical protein
LSSERRNAVEETIVITRTYRVGTFVGKVERRDGTISAARIRNESGPFALHVTNEWVGSRDHNYAKSLWDLWALVKKMIEDEAGA